jgi:hypothetical protein
VVRQLASPEALAECKLTLQQKACALYLTIIWLTSQYKVPFADFEGIPFYLVFTAAMYFVLPLTAVLHFAALLLVLGGYELLKSVQTDFVFSTKGALGLVAFSCVMSTVFFAVKQLRDCSATQLGNWLRLVLLAVAAAVAIEIGLTLDEFTQPAYQNYLLPIPAFTGLFTEPSHFALALSPFVFMLLIDFDGFRRHVGLPFVGVLVVLALLCPSGTLIGITALAACIWFSASALRMRIGGLAGVVILGMVVGLVTVFVPEISERVFGVLSANAYDPLGEQNLSALLFEKGKQMAEYALWNFPLGVAFLDMAILAPYAPVSYVADVVFYLNSQDGSSILFKGICELGILFIVFAVAAFVRFFKAATRANTFANLVVLSFQFSLFAHFIRAGSYFQGCLAIGLAVCIFELLQVCSIQHVLTLGSLRRSPLLQSRRIRAAGRI